MEMGRFPDAEADLKILLRRWERPDDLSEAERAKTSPDDADLMLMRGQCSAAKNEDEDARSGTKGDRLQAPRRIEAYQRLATLLRDRLKRPQDAEKAIEKMVKSDPENYHVYLARGHFRLSTPVPSQRDSLVAAAKQDFQKALELSSSAPDVYLEMANAEKTVSRVIRRGATNP